MDKKNLDKTMKKFEDYKEEIHRCSKCGLCQAVCPIYEETGNDCTVSRGQFIMLDGILKGDINLSRKVNKYLNMCLKCGKCKEFCPTGIDVVNILMSAKHRYFQKSFRGKIYRILESKFVFDNILKLVGSLFKLKHRVNRLFKSSSEIPMNETAKKAIYFGGCVEKFHPEIREFVVQLLNKMNIQVINIDFGCCGMPFLTTGNLDRFKEQIEANRKKLEDIEFDYVVTDCASCEYILREYVLGKDSKAQTEKLKNIYELINENNIKFESKTQKIVTFHKPCHEKHTEDILEIIKNIKNLEYKELEGFDKCCGFAGLEHPTSLKTVGKIIKKKGENINNSNADYLLTTCVGCVISAKISTLFRTKARRLISFLKDECKQS